MDIEQLSLQRLTVIVDSKETPGLDFYDLHHGLFVSRGVIPHEWTVKESTMTPVYAQLIYENGMTLFMDHEDFSVSQSQGLELGGKAEAPGLASRVLLSMDREVAGKVYINWNMRIPCRDSHSWLLNRFISPGILLEDWLNAESRIRFLVDVDGLNLYMDLTSDQTTNDDDLQTDDIEVLCGVRHEFSDNGNELIAWLSEWRKHESVMLKALHSLLGVSHD
ncbi:MAG: hypothetical protein OXJ55_09120 [Caldilineaceae bacterium]|nr:hypothetical protein [Caldilineaceae bacterium]